MKQIKAAIAAITIAASTMMTTAQAESALGFTLLETTPDEAIEILEANGVSLEGEGVWDPILRDKETGEILAIQFLENYQLAEDIKAESNLGLDFHEGKLVSIMVSWDDEPEHPLGKALQDVLTKKYGEPRPYVPMWHFSEEESQHLEKLLEIGGTVDEYPFSFAGRALLIQASLESDGKEHHYVSLAYHYPAYRFARNLESKREKQAAKQAEHPDTEIIAAGQRIKAEGRRVTGSSLRKEIGGGDPSRLLRVWQEHVECLSDSDQAEFPAGVDSVLEEISGSWRTVAQRLYHRALAVAHETVQEEIDALREDRDNAWAKVDDAADLVAEANDRVAEAEQSAAAARTERDQAEGRSNQLSSSLFRAEEQLEKAAESLAVRNEEIADLKAQAKASTREFDREKALSQRLQKQLASAEKEAENLKDQVRMALDGQASSANEEHEALRRAEVAESRLESCQKEVDRLTSLLSKQLDKGGD